eukprot:m.1609578 g.1609578  ORF g.1609578 m.1609578 type:complete len:65 (-) comp25365_c0_seq4:108-302(-)
MIHAVTGTGECIQTQAAMRNYPCSVNLCSAKISEWLISNLCHMQPCFFPISLNTNVFAKKQEST